MKTLPKELNITSKLSLLVVFILIILLDRASFLFQYSRLGESLLEEEKNILVKWSVYPGLILSFFIMLIAFCLALKYYNHFAARVVAWVLFLATIIGICGNLSVGHSINHLFDFLYYATFIGGFIIILLKGGN